MRPTLLWILLLISVGIFGVSVGANVMVTCQLNQALDRVQAAEAQTCKLVAQYEAMNKSLTQCDSIILERQNVIIQELRRLDFNQKTLIGIVAPVEGEDVE